MAQIRWWRQGLPDDVRIHKVTPKTPFSFQREAIERAAMLNTYISFTCGLGKTITAIETVKRVRPKFINKATLVVVSPKVATAQWRREILLQDPGTPVEVWDGDTQLRQIDSTEHIWIVTHYEFIEKLLPWLDKTLFCTVVADEAHHIKNPKARRSKALLKVHAIRKIALSGTPMEKSPADLWQVLNWLAPSEFRSYWKFVEQFVETQPGFRGVELVGTKNPEGLAKLVRPHMVRKTKKQVAPDMPPRIDTELALDLNKDQLKLHDTIRLAHDIEVDIGLKNPMIIAAAISRLTRLHQVASNPALIGVKDCSNTKFDWLEAYITDNPNEQILIFSRYRKNISELHARFGGGIILGGQDAMGIDSFIKGDTKLMFGTIKAMGTANDFPMASTSIFLDCEWSTILMTQALDRTHRLGITESKHIIYLTANRSVDKLVMRALRHKWGEAALAYQFIMAERSGDFEQETEGTDVSESTA